MNIDIQQLEALLKKLEELKVSEFEFEDGKIKLRLKLGGHQAHAAVTGLSAPPPAHPSGRSAADGVAAKAESDAAYVTSPFVGTFYRAASPDAAPFVDAGSVIRAGQPLCIIEAMKLMNEIEAEFGGTILECLVENGRPVEFGQRLFKVRKS